MNSLDTSTLGWSPGLLGAYITSIDKDMLVHFTPAFLPLGYLSDCQSNRVPLVRFVLHGVANVGLHLIVYTTGFACKTQHDLRRGPRVILFIVIKTYREIYLFPDNLDILIRATSQHFSNIGQVVKSRDIQTSHGNTAE